MKKKVIRISGLVLTLGLLSSFLLACEQRSGFRFLNQGGEGYWGEDYYYEDYDDYYEEHSKNNKKSSSNNGGGKSSSSNNGGSKDYKEEGFSYVYTVGSGECGVYAIANGLAGITDIEVPKTYTDKQNNVYQVKYDCNNGFNALADVKTITFQDGFEKVAVGFGSCIKLEKVVLPASFKKISCCMLVNCQVFKTIEFKGTMSQWNAVEKNEEWNYMAPSFTVKCSDGNIPVEALEDD